MKKKSELSIFLFLLIMIPLGAQSVRASMESTTAYVGQSVMYTIQISGTESAERPELWGFSDFSVAEAGESRSVNSSFVNGRASRQVISEFKWALTPLKTGDLTIPAVEVEIDGKTLATRKGVLQVKKPGKIAGYELFLTADSLKAFPGMPVRLTLKWLFSSQVSSPEFVLPFLENPDLEVHGVPAPSSGSNDIYELLINGEKVYAMQSSEIYEGKQYASLTMYWDLYPLKAGSLEISGTLLSFKRATGRDGWGNYSYENAVIPGNSLTLQVEDIPSELADFPGGVIVSRGTLELELSLDQKKVYPGDPVSLKGEFRNLSNPDVMDFKGFGNIPEVNSLFRVDKAGLTTAVEEGILTFSQTIRPLSGNVGEFPPLKIPYYNQQEGHVDIFVSEPLNLEVLALNRGKSVPEVGDGLIREYENSEEEDALSIHHNMSVNSLKTGPEIRISLFIFLMAPVLIYLIITGGLCFYRRHSRSLMDKIGGKQKSFRRLEKELNHLKRDPALDRLREFNAYLISWLKSEYDGLVTEDLTIDPEMACHYFSESQTDDLKEILEELDDLCWSGKSVDDLSFQVNRIAEKFSGKRKSLL